MTDTPAIRVQLTSNPLLFSGVREMVSSVARRFGFNELDSSMMSLAVDEALCNIMRHGYERRCDCPIWLSVFLLPEAGSSTNPALVWNGSASANGVAVNGVGVGAGVGLGDPSMPTTGRAGAMKIVLEDEARQVEVCNIKSRDLEDVRPGGLGVHIIKQVMDDVVYEKREGQGMRLTMVKRVSPPLPPLDDAAHAAPASNAGVSASTATQNADARSSGGKDVRHGS
jgi:serine/threonine-protein kinase RsbW